jgi:hypothetical protein
LVEKPEGKKSLGRPKFRSETNIEIDLTEKIWGGMNWINLAQDKDQ